MLYGTAGSMIPRYLFCLFVCTAAPPAGFSIYKGRSPSNGKLSDFSFYIDSQKSAHRKFKK